MGQLRQLQIRFDPEQDRLLLRCNTADRAEYRCWLTRRLVRRLWPALMSALARTEPVLAQPTPEARQAVLGFQREEALARSDFQTSFDEERGETPLGEAPILVSRVRLEQAGGRHRLRLLPREGRGVDLVLDDRMLHSLCELIERGVRGAQWDLPLRRGPPGAAPSRAGRPVH